MSDRLRAADARVNAGTAQAHDLAVATRNVRDFEGLGVAVVGGRGEVGAGGGGWTPQPR